MLPHATGDADVTGPGVPRATLLRGLGFFATWLALGAGTAPADLGMGAFAAALATAASLRLLPPARGALHPAPALRLLGATLGGSVLAGVDIARRAFDPRMPLQPGIVAVPLATPPGLALDGFRLVSSLQPGTLPAGVDEGGRLLLHALDTRLPVAAETQAAEALFRKARGDG